MTATAMLLPCQGQARVLAAVRVSPLSHDSYCPAMLLPCQGQARVLAAVRVFPLSHDSYCHDTVMLLPCQGQARTLAEVWVSPLSHDSITWPWGCISGSGSGSGSGSTSLLKLMPLWCDHDPQSSCERDNVMMWGGDTHTKWGWRWEGLPTGSAQVVMHAYCYCRPLLLPLVLHAKLHGHCCYCYCRPLLLPLVMHAKLHGQCCYGVRGQDHQGCGGGGTGPSGLWGWGGSTPKTTG